MRIPRWVGLLFLGDVLDLGASVALAALSPPPMAPVSTMTFDLPHAAQPLTLRLALLGFAAAALMTGSLVAEIVGAVRMMRRIRAIRTPVRT